MEQNGTKTVAQLLGECRYYKGEQQCPFESALHALFWRVEQMYVDACSKSDSRFETLVTEAMQTYLHYVLQDFEAKDGVPMPIKALILNRHLKYMEREDAEMIEHFKMFYRSNY